MPRTPPPARPSAARPDVLARLSPGRVRRAVSAALILATGAVLLLTALGQTTIPGGLRLFCLVLGGAAPLLAFALWSATAATLELTRTELREAGGRTLARVADMVAVSTGSFAFRPANGFRVRLRNSAAAHWSPGLWWRIGRSVGVGGATSRAEGAVMAATLTALLADRR